MSGYENINERAQRLFRHSRQRINELVADQADLIHQSIQLGVPEGLTPQEELEFLRRRRYQRLHEELPERKLPEEIQERELRPEEAELNAEGLIVPRQRFRFEVPEPEAPQVSLEDTIREANREFIPPFPSNPQQEGEFIGRLAAGAIERQARQRLAEYRQIA